MHLVLVKCIPERTRDVVSDLKGLPERPTTGVSLPYSYNVFGTWDFCIWFDAKNHDRAMGFVQNKIRPITGVIETYTMPTTPIKEYTIWE